MIITLLMSSILGMEVPPCVLVFHAWGQTLNINNWLRAVTMCSLQERPIVDIQGLTPILVYTASIQLGGLLVTL